MDEGTELVIGRGLREREGALLARDTEACGGTEYDVM